MRKILMCAALALATLSPPVHAQNRTLQTVMQDKLMSAQDLLEALVRGNFTEIDRSAETLSRITDTEIASWQAVSQPGYTEMASRFLLSVEGLRDAAADRDLDGVLREYTTMIAACTNCHVYVRDSGRAD